MSLNWFDRLDFWFPAYTTCGALIGLVIAALLGGVHAVVLVLALAALEFALSAGDGLDALTQLKERGPAWREQWMFGVPGLVIAVLVSRFLLPLAVIAVVGGTTPWQAVHLAFSSHDPYYRQISTAGSGFALFAVGLLLVMAARIAIERNNEWRRIRAYHRRMNASRRSLADLASGRKPKESRQISLLWALPAAVAVLAVVRGVGGGPTGDRILLAGLFGAATGMILVWIATSTQRRVNRELRTAGVAHWYPADTTAPSIADIGLLVLTDATLAVDSVASSFVVTANLIVISIGLGIGTLFIRDFAWRGSEMVKGDSALIRALGAPIGDTVARLWGFLSRTWALPCLPLATAGLLLANAYHPVSDVAKLALLLGAVLAIVLIPALIDRLLWLFGY